MKERRQRWSWVEEDGEEMLWCCPACGAECNVDHVGNECPRCGIPVEEEELEHRIANKEPE